LRARGAGILGHVLPTVSFFSPANSVAWGCTATSQFIATRAGDINGFLVQSLRLLARGARNRWV
jgi:hypothetical protein